MYVTKQTLEKNALEINKWRCSMIWCPSQCYKHVVASGEDYILYLRWRWEDPWQGHIIVGASDYSLDGEWSPDLLEQRNLHFADDDVEDAKAAISAIWRDMYGQGDD